MIRHVAMFRWVPDATDAQRQAVVDGLAHLAVTVPGIEAYHYGPDAGINEGNWDLVVTADFATVDDYCGYRDHPAHQAFIAECIAPIRADRAAVQFETG